MLRLPIRLVAVALLSLSVADVQAGQVVLPEVDKPPPIAAPHSSDDFAVVIGNQAYARLPEVAYAAHDATVFREYLLATVGLQPGHVDLLVDAYKEEVADKLRAIRARNPPRGTRVWVYFSGHGAAHPDGAHPQVLLDVGTLPNEDGVRQSGMTVAWMNELLGPDLTLMVIADACFNGKTREGDDLVTIRGVVLDDSYASAGDSIVWSAAAPGQTARPLPLGATGHGAFTYALMLALQGQADGALGDAKDGAVTLAEAYAFVKSSVADLGFDQQTPTMSAPPGVAPTLPLVAGDLAPRIPLPKADRTPVGKINVLGASTTLARVDGVTFDLSKGPLRHVEGVARVVVDDQWRRVWVVPNQTTALEIYPSPTWKRPLQTGLITAGSIFLASGAAMLGYTYSFAAQHPDGVGDFVQEATIRGVNYAGWGALIGGGVVLSLGAGFRARSDALVRP